MSDTPTPRTDDEVFDSGLRYLNESKDDIHEVVSANFARQLERELADADSVLKNYAATLGASSPMEGLNIIDGMRSELAAANASRNAVVEECKQEVARLTTHNMVGLRARMMHALDELKRDENAGPQPSTAAITTGPSQEGLGQGGAAVAALVARLREWITVPLTAEWPTRNMDDDLREAADAIERLAKDAARFRFLQNLPIVKAQQYFWNFNSRKQRESAIDEDILTMESAEPIGEGQERSR